VVLAATATAAASINVTNTLRMTAFFFFGRLQSYLTFSPLQGGDYAVSDFFFTRGRRLLHQRVTDAQSAPPRAGGSAYSPSSFGIGADPGHHEQRKPSTSVPTEASG
jgi:hypothetical protein